MRRVLAAAVLLWAFTPSSAHAQQSPLYNCDPKTFKLSFTGPGLGGSDVGQVSGAVELVCDDTTVFADEMKWDEKTFHARGSVLIVQQGLRVTAERADMDRTTRLGTFYKAAGTAQITDKPVQGGQFGTLEPEVSFYAEKIERLGPRTYRLTNGWFSTCLQANPRWDIRGSSGTITLDDHVLLRNAVMRVKSIPVLYLPFMYYPLSEDDRSTGFLIPTYSRSSFKGQGISNAFFWAINRWQDATFYHDYYSKAGQEVAGAYEYMLAPGSFGNTKVSMLNEPTRFAEDGTVERAGRRSYKINGGVNQRLGRGFRMFGNVNYFTDITTNQLYQQDVYQASRQQRTISATLSGRVSRYFDLTARADQTDVYFNATSASRQGKLPQVRLDFRDRPIGRSKIYFGLKSELVGFRNQSDINQPATNHGLWRYDALQTLRAPLSKLPYLSASVASSLRLTHWTDSANPITGAPEPVAITRPIAELSADVTGPTVARIFQTPKSSYAERFKHIIEPRVNVKWLSPFDHINNVINNDAGVDCMVGGNTTVTYSLTNSLLARRKAAGRVQNVLSGTISQTYYSRDAAGACDTQYQTSTAGRYSAVQISATATPTDSIQGQFRMSINSRTRQPEQYSASLSGSTSTSQVSAIWTKRQFLAGVPGFDNEAAATHFLYAVGSWHTQDRRYGTTAGFRLDVKNKFFTEKTVSAFYNAQCCGVSVDYQIVDIAPFGVSLHTDHRFNFSFTLAGIGSFSNPLGSFGR